MKIINKIGLKKKFATEGLKVSGAILEKVIDNQERNIQEEIKIISRRVKLSGRKTVKEEDL